MYKPFTCVQTFYFYFGGSIITMKTNRIIDIDNHYQEGV